MSLDRALPPPTAITLVTAPGCHFCEDAHKTLTELTHRDPSLALQLVEAATPLPAMRSGSTATETRTFTLHGPDATIVASIAGERDGVGLTLRLEGEDGEPLADQRVFLRRHGRSLYSARTGVDGVLRMPGIEHGVYEVDCPGIATAFQLDLRV